MNIKYFDHAATTPVDKVVLKEMLPYFSDEFGNVSSLYTIGKSNKEVISIARMKIASILDCKVNEVYFTSGGSESDNMIIKGIAFANKHKGDHIITSTIEHPAVLNSCRYLEKFGFNVSYIDPNENGIINPEDILSKINRKTILISIMYANNEIGTIQRIKEIGEIARKYNIYFHTDAVQAVGNVKIDVKKEKIDALSLSAHKFYGPKGVGVAYINENVNFLRYIDGGHQEQNKRAGTENVAGIVGLAKALELANENIEKNNEKILNLRNYFIKELKEKIPFIKINGDIESRLPGNINISLKFIDGNEVVSKLNKNGFCISSGSACSAGLLNPSHVLLAIGLDRTTAKSSIRITIGKNNTKEEIDELINEICNIYIERK